MESLSSATPARGRLRAEGNGRKMKRLIRLLPCRVGSGGTLAAQAPGSLLGVSFAPSKGSLSLSVPMQIIVLLTLLAILPAVIMSVTPFLAHHRGAALPPASLEYPGNTLQSGSDWSGAVSDAGDHAAGGDGHVPQRMGAARGRTGNLAAGLVRWLATIEDLLAALCPGKRRAPLSGHLSYSRAARSRPGSGWEC